jgi:hypothetical protein
LAINKEKEIYEREDSEKVYIARYIKNPHFWGFILFWRHLPESNRLPELCRLLYDRSTKAPSNGIIECALLFASFITTHMIQ